ncbi:MAG: transporter substrate-binding domain-containing protein, partial [Acidobacteriota bacterium]
MQASQMGRCWSSRSTVKKALSVSCAALCSAALGVVGVAASEASSELPAELNDGKLSVIVFPVYDEPFIAPNLAAGLLPERGGAEHFQGIDIDLMVGFAESLGTEVEFLRLNEPGFGALLPALVEGQADMVASALTITAERDEVVDFSRPYFEVSTVVVARRDSGIRSIEDLEGKTAVGVKGSRPFAMLEGQGVRVETLEADFQTSAYAAVVEGEADFAMMESASARFA